MNLEQRLAELETRLAFQDDTIDALNRALADQQQRIAELETLCRHLLTQLRELQTGTGDAPAAHEKPPHY